MKRLYTLSIVLVLLIGTSCKTRQESPVHAGPFTSVVHPEWMKSAVMYEVNIRQYTPEGTLDAFSAKLPELQKLGVGILWLMPIYPIGEVNRKGPLGSYYSVKDYEAVNPEFGTMEDFKALVKKAHDLGMHLILDWVPNHSAWDNPLVEQHPEWYAKDSLGKMFSPWDWTDVVKFDYNQRPLREYMIDAMKFWITETGVDGFRFDVAHQVPVDFWDEVRPALQQVKPDVLLMAEAEMRPMHERSMDISYGWELHHILNAVAQGKQNVDSLNAYFDRASRDYNTNDIRMYFTSNHDENSWNGTAHERMGAAYPVMTVLTYTVPGMPLIYSGQEAGETKRLKFFERDPIDWSHPVEFDFYRKLDELKKSNPALWNPGFGGSFERIQTNEPHTIFAFKRVLGKNSVLVVLNLSGREAQVTLPSGTVNGKFTDFFTGQRSNPDKAPLPLKPWGYYVFTK